MTDTASETISLLCSGNSLGVYVPAIQLDYQLQQKGVTTEIHILESVYPGDVLARVPAIKQAFHKHFALAKKSAQLVRDIKDTLDPAKVSELLNQWRQEKRTRFIVFTGFWIPILEQYRKIMDPVKLDVDLLRMDAGDSASYQVYGERCDAFRNVWFFSAEENQVLREFPITTLLPVPFSLRDKGVVLHGGGWGIGTYREAKKKLLDAGNRLHVLAYDLEEFVPHDQVQYYMNDPHWNPWSLNEQGKHSFPALALLKAGMEPKFRNQDCHPLLFDVIRNSKAIVSKPGGYSLFESFAAATPFVFLEPFARHEAVNAEFWINQGFGIWFEDWEQQHFSNRCLEELHKNLLHAREKFVQGGKYDATKNNSEI
ncbi:hypothetical protein [Paenibacillus puerhi]|uniref:hypothetical protein n=1 Tax=Paenibacillus puerhi TaxID=2692622 RepID=UPI00135904FE|nr:hypothetical protein [Paenibacillus puerhi]